MGSPQSDEVHYLRVRPVPRLQDHSEITIIPETAKNETKTIELRVKPKLKRITVKSAGLRVTASVEILDNDDRLTQIDPTSTTTQDIRGNTGDDLVFKYRMESNGDYDPLKFKVTLEYSLADCTDSYQKPCPVFDSEDDEFEDQITEDQKITKTLKTKTLNFNICKDVHSCKCDVEANIEKTEEIIAGEGKVIRLGNLILSNSGTEASYNTKMTVSTIDPAAKLGFPGTESGNCRQEGPSTRSCSLFVDKKSPLRKPIELVPVSPIRPGVKEITVRVGVTDNCRGKNNTRYNKTLTIPVVHRWSLKPVELTAGKDSQVSWYYNSPDRTLSKSLDYIIKNEGPSISTETHLFVYLPKHPFIENTIVEFDKKICSEGDTDYLQTPPAVSRSSGKQMQISCTMRGDCLVYKCEVNQTEKTRSQEKGTRNNLQVRYEFKHQEAKEESGGVTEFSVVASVCVRQAEGSQDCSKAGETLTTRSQFIYYPPSTLDQIYSNWQIIVAVAATILVFVITLVLAWKFDLFQRARIVRNQGEAEGLMEDCQTNEASVPTEMEITDGDYF